MIYMVMAVYKMDIEIVKRFMDMNDFNDISVVAVSDKEYDLGYDNLTILKYPEELKIFSLAKTNNYGIRSIQCSEEDIIIKTDPDIKFSRNVLDFVKSSVKYKNGLVCICANKAKVEQAQDNVWKNSVKRTKGRGACFAMTKKDWYDLNGYDERLDGWGGDDEELWRRASKKINMKQDWTYPLYHINHPNRKGVKEFFPINSKKNMSIAKKNDWKSDSWGIV